MFHVVYISIVLKADSPTLWKYSIFYKILHVLYKGVAANPANYKKWTRIFGSTVAGTINLNLTDSSATQKIKCNDVLILIQDTIGITINGLSVGPFLKMTKGVDRDVSLYEFL